MTVTSLTPKSKTRTRVEIDYDTTLVLSNRDVYLYNLRVGEEIPENVWDMIRDEQKSSALRKCGSLLQDMDYARQGLIDKLIRAGYPEDIATEAADRMEEAHYIDDRRLSDSYLKYHLNDKSLARIRQDLLRKGVPGTVIEEAIAAYREENEAVITQQEEEQIRQLLAKRHFDLDTADYAEIQKTIAFLLRKGYAMETIRKVMKEQ